MFIPLLFWVGKNDVCVTLSTTEKSLCALGDDYRNEYYTYIVYPIHTFRRHLRLFEQDGTSRYWAKTICATSCDIYYARSWISSSPPPPPLPCIYSRWANNTYLESYGFVISKSCSTVIACGRQALVRHRSLYGRTRVCRPICLARPRNNICEYVYRIHFCGIVMFNIIVQFGDTAHTQ